MTQAHPDIIPFPGRQPTAPPDANPPVLIVSCDMGLTHELAGDLQAVGHATRTASSLDAAVQWLQATPADVCLIGPLSPGETAGQLASIVQQRGWTAQLIALCEASAEGALQLAPASTGIEPLPRSYTLEFLALQVTAAGQRGRLLAENRRLKRQLCNRNLRDMVGHSAAMHAVRQQVQTLADDSCAVLITGERGSGVDLVAQAIHDASKRAHRPFVAIDCSVHSADTLELELFGASAPGGGARQPGRLEQADGGTLLLDNVHCIALPLQRRLAAVLHDQRFECDRSGERIRFDVRVFQSTDVDLDELLHRGLFRAELLHDADRHRLTVPTLRSRPDDIAALVEHCLRKVAAREGRTPRSLTLDALHLLQNYQWPGNVLELEHVIERACAIDAGRKLTASMLEPWLATAADDDTPTGLTLADMERRLIETTFTRFAGNREKTAKALQIGIRTLSGKLREYGYPPRGGPGSNVRPWTPSVYEETTEQRAA